ncbi:SCO family protein [Thalassotalea aquiviva]|uniref:SCO family protein n=1 Tax=Thalassotalea aquiviva TaxID=3242415 RepID=UPI00352B8FF5
MNKTLVFILAVAAAALGVFFYQYQQQQSEPEHALLYPQPRLLSDFELTDHNGQSFSKAQLQDKWSLFFIGYTSCPDVCPMTLQELTYIYPKLQALTNNKVQVVLVSADPKRDTVSKLNSYIRYFNPDFVAVRAEHDVLYPFTRNLGLMYAIADTNEEYYLVNHSASIVMTNPQGNIQAIFKPLPATEPGSIPSIDQEALVTDFEKIYHKLKE